MKTSPPPIYDPASFSREESIGYLISAVKARLVVALDAELDALGLTGAQFGTLMCITHDEAETAADICRLVGCDTGAMTRMLDRLEEKQLVSRERSNDDRRVIHIHPTALAGDITRQAFPAAVAVLNRHLAGFSRDEVETLKSLLRRMLANAS